MWEQAFAVARGRYWPGLTVATAALLVGTAALADATVTAIGSVWCTDTPQGAAAFPLAGARVELMDSDCDGSEICDDVMRIGHTDAMGNFSVQGTGGDVFGGDPDVYVRIVYNDDVGVRLTNEIDSSQSFSTDQHAHNNVGSGTINFGRLTPGADSQQGQGTRCGVWSRGRKAYTDYTAEMGSIARSGHLDILYWSAIWSGKPWTNTDTIHWPINYSTGIINHEFGHIVRHSADGNGAHFTNDVVRFRYARGHDRCPELTNAQGGESYDSERSYGFNEGWAWFWAGSTSRCAVNISPAVEGNIAGTLESIRTLNGLSRRDMMQVLLDNPGSIHDIDEYYNALKRRLGLSIAPLTAVPLPRPGMASVKAQVPAQIETQRQRRIGEEIARLDARIAQMSAPQPVIPAAQVPAFAGPCQRDACEAIFNRIVGPLLRDGEIRAAQAFRAQLVSAASPAWPARVQEELASGQFDLWLERYRRQTRQAVRAPMLDAVRKASLALRDAQARLGPSYPEFDKRLNRAYSQLASAKGQPGAAGFVPAALRSMGQ